jgi:flagellar assembly protein FliH
MPAGASEEGGTPAFTGGNGRLGKGKPATLEEIEQNAYCRGFADGEAKGLEQGMRAGTEAAENQLSPLLDSLRQAIAEMNALRRRTCTSLEAELVQLALGVARKIVGREVDTNPDRIAYIIRLALSRVENATHITIRLNPSDLKRLDAIRPQLLAGLTKATRADFQADASLSPGDCWIESDLGDVDARVETQLQVVADAFRSEWNTGVMEGS